jgi:hypothetical protein
MTHVGLMFTYSLPAAPEVRDVTADIALIDQFNNYHWLKGLRFQHVENIRL